MTRRSEFAAMIPQFLSSAAGAPLHIELLYALAAARRPDLIDDEPDPQAPNRLKWQHDFRWELKTAARDGRIVRRDELGRGYYSAPLPLQTTPPETVCTVRIAPIEKVTGEDFKVRPSSDWRSALRAEARLVQRYEHWANDNQRALGRVEFRLPDGERLVADAYDADRHLLIEAKGSCERQSIRMALGQLLDYRFALGSQPAIAVLLPTKPHDSLVCLLRSCDVGLIFETEAGSFTEQL